MGLRWSHVVMLTALICFPLVACGGGADAGSGAGSASKAPVVPTLERARDAKGDVTICTPIDSSGDKRDLVKTFNARYGAQGVKAKLVEFPASADDQHAQIVQRQEAKSSECDIYEADTVFMAEFVSQRWVLDMTDYVRSRATEFIPSTLSTARVGGRYYGVPYDTDAPLLFYRTDAVRRPPATWQSLYRTAKAGGGLVYQGFAYEGLTCDFLDVAFAAGGEVLSKDQQRSAIDSPQNRAALQLMVDGIDRGAAPKAVTTYKEEESRRAFETGRYAYMRNWPYAYALGNLPDSKIKGDFAVAPLPAFAGAGHAGVLGGKDYVVSAYSENPDAAMLMLDYATSAAQNRRRAIKFARAPVIGALYDDADVKRALPFAAQLRTAVARARVRPVSPVYPQISEAIYKNVNAALSGQASPEDALARADEQINKALESF